MYIHIMARNIMVSDEVYEELKRLKGPEESFSDVIKKLLASRRGSLLDMAGSGTITEEGAKLLERYKKAMALADSERLRKLLEGGQ